jgi:hypothetical protein
LIQLLHLVLRAFDARLGERPFDVVDDVLFEPVVRVVALSEPPWCGASPWPRARLGEAR